jgi:hypothetical protein
MKLLLDVGKASASYVAVVTGTQNEIQRLKVANSSTHDTVHYRDAGASQEDM